MTGPTSSRYIELDVVRAIALIGVCVMNFHGYLIIDGAKYPPTTFVERIFDPWQGPLSTRFAATFVTVAGMGITLLTRRSCAGASRAAISADRWKLARRGVLLFTPPTEGEWVLAFHGRELTRLTAPLATPLPAADTFLVARRPADGQLAKWRELFERDLAGAEQLLSLIHI